MSVSARVPIIDVHVHCLSGEHSAAGVACELTALGRDGLDAMVLIMSPTFDMTTRQLADMYPPEAQPVSQRSHAFELPFGQEVIDHLDEPALVLPFLAVQTYLPMLMAGGDLDDCMALVEQQLRTPLAGLKVHYFGTQIGPILLERQYGMSPDSWDQDRFDGFVQGYVDIAAARDLPIVVHVDLREARQGFVELVSAHPGLQVCLCHLGYSRRLCAEVLEELPALVTDLSGIELHRNMWERLDAYGRFVADHADRVLFGSDQYIGDPEALRASWDLMGSLGLEPEVELRVRAENARRFLGFADAAPAV